MIDMLNENVADDARPQRSEMTTWMVLPTRNGICWWGAASDEYHPDNFLEPAPTTLSQGTGALWKSVLYHPFMWLGLASPCWALINHLS